MLSYRRSSNENPMSDWGHAMFSDDKYAVECYGDNEFVLNTTVIKNIEEIKDLILEAYEDSKEGGLHNVNIDEEYLFTDLDFDAFFELFDPADIVDSASAWDCGLVTWIWEAVLEPNNIYAIKTQDGAICFDQDLIKLNK